MNNDKRISLRMNAETHKQLKIKCFQEDISMQDKIMELIKKYLKEE